MLFPRFFFVSDTTLLAILGLAGDLRAVQPHMLSLFSNIKCLQLDDRRSDTITSVQSSEGEILQVGVLLVFTLGTVFFPRQRNSKKSKSLSMLIFFEMCDM
jgi:hypothetical protein